MNDYSEVDKKIFDWYEIAMDILCMAYSVNEIDQINRLVETYTDIMRSVKDLIKKSNFYKYVNEPFLRRWYYSKNKRRLTEKAEESPLIYGFQFLERAGYFFNKRIDL